MSIRTIACVVSLAALVAVPSLASAQQIGLKGGINFASLTPEEEDEEPLISRRRGPIGGVWVATPFSENFALQFEALFSEKGMKVEGIPAAGLDYAKVRMRYLELPILARRDLGAPRESGRLFVVGGLAPAFELSARATVSVQGEERSNDIGDQIKPFDLGLVGGIGVGFGRVHVEGRYTHGLLHTNEDDNGDDGIRNRVFSVMGSVRFR